jgi:hypothetical protein
VEWERRPERTRLLWAFGLASGLAASNHHTIVFIAPACIVLLVSGGRKLLDGRAAVWMTPSQLARQGAIAAGLLVVGLLPYLYLPLAASADPPLNWGDPRTPDAFFRHLTRADYGTFRLTVTDHPVSGSPLEHVGLLLRNLYDGFTPLGYLLAIAGARWLTLRRPAVALALGLAFLFTGPIFVAYANPYIDNPILLGVLERFYILPSVFFAMAVGLGAYQVLVWVVQLAARGGRRLTPAIGFALLAIPLAAMVVHFSRADHSDNFVDHNFGTDMLSPIEPGALFITQGDVVTMVVDYLQLAEGMRPDIATLDIEKLKLASYVRQMRREHPDVVIPFESYVPTGDQMAQLVEANWGSRPVYLLGSPKDPGFLDRFDFARVGFVTRLFPKGSTPDRYTLMEPKLDQYKAFQFPTRLYPETTFESSVVGTYGVLAFDIAYILDDGVHDAEAIDYYRQSIKLAPKNATAYKNLGLLLKNRGAGPDEVGPLWEEFLRQAPNDEQAPAVRQELRQMGRPQ